MDETKDEAKGEYKKGGYGKKPLWFWIVLYLIIAVIVYFLVYYFFLRGPSSPTQY